MTEWAKWTDAEPVTDELMLDKWGGLITYMTRQVAQSYGLSDYFEDIRQSMTVALLKLPQDKRPLTGYTKTTLNNALRSALRDLSSRGASPVNNWREYQTLDYLSAAPSEDSDDDATAALDRLAGCGLGEDALITQIALKEAVEALPALEREAIEMVYLHGYQVQEVAAHQRVSRTIASRRIHRALNKLKARLA